MAHMQQKQIANTLLDVGKRHASVKQDNSHLNLLEHVLPLSAGRVSASWYTVSKRVTMDMNLWRCESGSGTQGVFIVGEQLCNWQ